MDWWFVEWLVINPTMKTSVTVDCKDEKILVDIPSTNTIHLFTVNKISVLKLRFVLRLIWLNMDGLLIGWMIHKHWKLMFSMIFSWVICFVQNVFLPRRFCYQWLYYRLLLVWWNFFKQTISKQQRAIKFLRHFDVIERGRIWFGGLISILLLQIVWCYIHFS